MQISRVRALLSTGITSVIALLLLTMPGAVHADVSPISVQTRQLIAGNTSCSQPMVRDMRPYVYDGHLNSFDVTVADPAQVVVASVVAGQPIPFNQATRWGTGTAGEVRMHVDIERVPVANGLPIQMTLLSTGGTGSAVCVTIVSFNLSQAAEPVTPVISQNIPAHPVYPTHATSNIPMPQVTASPAKTPTSGIRAIGIPGIHMPSKTGLASGTPSIRASVADACHTLRSASNTWAILLVLYAILVAYASIVRPGMLARSAEALAATIVVPFVLLVAFWYFVDVCRPGQWVQLLAPAIALIGLVVALD
jgi:hypothetical protein